MPVFFRTSTEAIGTVFSTPSRSDVAEESAYEGSHDAKAAGNLPASPNATRSPMDSISLHWNTSPQLPAALPAAHPVLAAGSCFVLDSEAPPRRVDVFQLHLIHANAEMVQLGQFLH